MGIDVEIDGKTITLDVVALGDPMDSFLKGFYSKFFSEFEQPFNLFIKDCYQDLEANIYSYLDGKVGVPLGQDNLFTNLTIIWRNYQFKGRLGEAEDFWKHILNIILNWEGSRNSRIHKGSLYYFWSQTAISLGQLDKGFFLIHCAYEEDVLTSKNDLPGTPAFKTVSLNFSDKQNLLYSLVRAWANYLDTFVSKYQNDTGSKFSLEDFKTKFLNHPPTRDTLFSFTYALAKLYDLDSFPPVIVQGKFASLYELNSLRNLVQVIEAVIYSSIQAPAQDDWKFINLAKHLLIKSGISNNPVLTITHMKHINDIKDLNFEKTLTELLDKTLIYPDGIRPSGLECDIAISYCLRNYSAHNLDSFPIIRNRFSDIRQSVFNVLFLASEMK